jgi:hypothetical protein
MSLCTRDNSLQRLELPDAFEDLTGILSSDLKVMVTALAERAGERLLLSRQQSLQLKFTLWNNVTRVVNETMEGLTVERQ